MMAFSESGFWILLLISLFAKGCSSLKNVKLTIEPKVVQRYGTSLLRCQYELENEEQLYTVQWYRGQHEFYRYTPHQFPHTRLFPFGGISIDVNRSTDFQVVLRNIELNLSGNFSCEVTTANQPIQSKSDTQTMLVVHLPDNPPQISVGKEPLDYGDVLTANCSSFPSRPPASLKLILNNITVARTKQKLPKNYPELQWSDLGIEIKLSEKHFDSGRLILRCTAQIFDVYHEEVALELGSRRNPTFERVSAYDGSSSLKFDKIMNLFALSLLLNCYSYFVFIFT